jgi:hypothetical protein
MPIWNGHEAREDGLIEENTYEEVKNYTRHVADSGDSVGCVEGYITSG